MTNDLAADAGGWIRQAAAGAGLGTVHAVVRVKHDARSSVLDVRTSGGPLLFKATRAGSEPPLTALLYRDHPAHVPPVIAIDADRGWMLVRRVEGRLLFLTSDLAAWCDAFRTLGRIQRSYVRKVAELADVGCERRSLDWVRLQMAPAVDRMLAHHEIADRLTADERRLLVTAMPQWDALCDLGGDNSLRDLPDATLDHGDLHAHNILMTTAGAVYLDWEAAGIGHPFFSAHTLLGYVGRLLPEMRGSGSMLRDAFLEPWCEWYPSKLVTDVFDRVRPLASLKYAFGLLPRPGRDAAPVITDPRELEALRTAVVFCLKAALEATFGLRVDGGAPQWQ
jgi:aminoglycoside phosphotransferase (APT) family kinase protein